MANIYNTLESLKVKIDNLKARDNKHIHTIENQRKEINRLLIENQRLKEQNKALKIMLKDFNVIVLED